MKIGGLKFSANLSFLFNEVPFLERFEAARSAGFTAVEYMFPYDFDAHELKARLDALGLQQVLFNMPVPDFASGGKGLLILPDRAREFRESVRTAIRLCAGSGREAGELSVGAHSCGRGSRFAAADGG